MRFFALLRRRLLVIAFDICVITIAWFGAYWLRYDGMPSDVKVLAYALQAFPIILILQSLGYWVFGLYRGIWRFASLPDLIRIVKAVVFGGITALFVLFFLTRLEEMPRSIVPIYSMLLVFLLGGARFSFRYFSDKARFYGQKVLIIGANQYGEALVRELIRAQGKLGAPVAFIDDRITQQGKEIQGVRVVGQYKDIAQVVQKLMIDLIIISLPKVSAKQMRALLNMAEATLLPVRVLPGVDDMVSGKVTFDSLRKISLEDLLGREELAITWEIIEKEISGKQILITGAGGSIGSELCRQVAKLKPKTLLMLDYSEYNLFAIQQEFLQKFPSLDVRYHLVNIVDAVGVKHVMSTYYPDIVFHAAAYKHVPLLEDQVREAVLNNVLGTKNVAEAAIAVKVKRFVLVSTDKAVNPTNVMGTTKRIVEMLCQELNNSAVTEFTSVRFGNVLGSVGSVVPIFQQQLEQGGPLTVTHPDVERFFMSIAEASQLILQTLTVGNGGETLILDMGEPIKIRFLAEQVIHLSGKQPGKDVDIEYVGLRPGEKLKEKLLYKNESLLPTSHNKIMKTLPFHLDWSLLKDYLEELEIACHNYDTVAMKELLQKILQVEFQEAATAKNTQVEELV